MVDKQTFFGVVQDAIRKERKEENLVVSEEIRFSVYGLDSLDMMNVLVSIEESLDASFEDIEITEDDTVLTFYDKVTNHISS